MAEIKVLHSSIYNKIAAGEVVDRPASVVKELVENSIDAGATKLEIIVENGGLSSICIIDNGCGIQQDSIETAFLKHATSKLKIEEDLYRISTLGFRGEALPSIAAVSKLELTTKTADDEFATKITLEGGEIISKIELGAQNGTTIKVSDLFFNTPARKKFLKTPAGETVEITNVVQKLILANPKVAIKYTANNKLIFNSQGLSLESAIFAAYDKQTLANCEKISWTYKDIQVFGYVGNKDFVKPNRTYQTSVINGRHVSNMTISMAVQRAFGNYLMKRTYPFFVLHINLPADQIDVNVHPNKMEVKFEDQQGVFYAVYVPVKEMLAKDSGEIPEIKRSAGLGSLQELKKQSEIQQQIKQLEEEEKSQKPKSRQPGFLHVDPDTGVETFYKRLDFTYEELTKDHKGVVDLRNGFSSDTEFTISKETQSSTDNENLGQYSKVTLDKDLEKDIIDVIFDRRTTFRTPEEIAQDNIKAQEEQIQDEAILATESMTFNPQQCQMQTFNRQEVIFAESTVVGNAFDTYVIIQRENDLFFVDQHAAHEMLLYKKYTESYTQDKNIKQPLLIPYVFKVKHDEAEFITKNLQKICDCGFEIEDFGSNNFKISEVPLMFFNINFDKFVNSFLHDLDANEIDIKYINDKLARAACRSAVKAGDRLTQEDMDYLKKQLDNAESLRCPHGRPVVVKISKYEIEKWFKRVI